MWRGQGCVRQGYSVIGPDYRGSTGGRVRGRAYSAPHIGKTVQGDIQEYLKRSPITYVDKLEMPLLIHSNTNDEDLNVIEVQRFRRSSDGSR